MIQFTPDFVDHLGYLGIDAVPPGVRLVDDGINCVVPVTICGVDLWAAPATIGAFSCFGTSGRSDVATCVGDLDNSIAAGAVIPYEPALGNLVEEYGRFRMIQALLQQKAA